MPIALVPTPVALATAALPAAAGFWRPPGRLNGLKMPTGRLACAAFSLLAARSSSSAFTSFLPSTCATRDGAHAPRPGPAGKRVVPTARCCCFRLRDIGVSSSSSSAADSSASDSEPSSPPSPEPLPRFAASPAAASKPPPPAGLRCSHPRGAVGSPPAAPVALPVAAAGAPPPFGSSFPATCSEKTKETVPSPSDWVFAASRSTASST